MSLGLRALTGCGGEEIIARAPGCTCSVLAVGVVVAVALAQLLVGKADTHEEEELTQEAIEAAGEKQTTAQEDEDDSLAHNVESDEVVVFAHCGGIYNIVVGCVVCFVGCGVEESEEESVSDLDDRVVKSVAALECVCLTTGPALESVAALELWTIGVI